MQLCWALALLSNGLWTGSFSPCSNAPGSSLQSALSLSFPVQSALPALLSPRSPSPAWSSALHGFSLLACLTGLVGLVDWFFYSLVVGVPCSLIFWHFWWFIDFRLVVILLLVVWGSEGFLPMYPSWLELWTFKKKDFICLFLERGEEREKERERNMMWERNMDQLLFLHALTGDLIANPGKCPDWGLNWRPFAFWGDVQSAEPHQSGWPLWTFFF